MNRLALVVFTALPLVASAKLNVVATTADLGSIAREVGGDDASVTTLARPTQDPHFVDAKPSLVISLSRAQLLVVTGMDLEIGWLPVLLTGSRNADVQKGAPGYLDCSTLIAPKEVPSEKIDRSMGDIHPGGNPHYSKDPRNGVLLARGIAQRMGELDPPHAAAYKARAEKLAADLNARIATWTKELAPFAHTPVVTYHKSWFYFTEWAGLDEVAFIEPKPGLAPSSGHVAKVLMVMKSRKVPVILQEDWYEAATSTELAQLAGARLVRVPGMPGDSQSYADYENDLVTKLVQGLKPGS